MEQRLFVRSAGTICLALLFPLVSWAGATSRYGIPNETGGVFLACDNAERILLVDRDDGETRVSQFTPQGKAWSWAVPAMEWEYDHYIASPDGEAVIVYTANREDASHLVTRRGALELDIGHVITADFHPGMALIAGAKTWEGGPRKPVEVGIMDLESGRWRSRHAVSEPIETTVDRDFFMRLTADGKHFYYVVEERPGQPSRVEIRDVETGRAIDRRVNLMAHGEIYDLVLLTEADGYLIAREGLFLVRNGVVSRLSLPDGLSRAWRVIDLDVAGLHAVKSDYGWAVRHWPTGRWVASGRDMADIRPAPGGWMLLERSVHRHGIAYFRYRAGRADIVREIAGKDFPGRRNQLVCANAFGAMGYEDGRFRWVQTAPTN